MAVRGGFLAFAPQLAAENDGFSSSHHDLLDDAQTRSFWFAERNRLIVDLLGRYFPQAHSFLEIGCGTGYVLSGVQHAQPDISLAGCEIHLAGLTHARKRLGDNVELFQADARHIPFVEAFDVVAAFDVLEHITDDRSALVAMRDAVKPGGGLMLSVPQHPFLWSESDRAGHHKRRYRRGELARKVRDAKMEVMFQTSFVSTLLPLMMAQRMLLARRTDYRPESELSLPRWLDNILTSMLRFERALIRSRIRFAVGGSRFVLARRPN